MLVEARLVDQETVWNKERENMDRKMVEITEKHEHEISEKELHLQSLQRSVNEMESAYQAAISQYSVLQVYMPPVDVCLPAGGPSRCDVCVLICLLCENSFFF